MVANKHAIVLGGGYAGLLAAKVLADYFAEVTLIERFADFMLYKNRLNDDGNRHLHVRQGIPQAYHLHVLLKQGQNLLERFFPGIIAKLVDYGCPRIDWAKDTKWYSPFGVYPQYPCAIETISCSRMLLDALMIEQIIKIKNIKIRIAEMKNFFNDDDHQKIIGVQLRNTEIENADNHLINLHADLVIDARGRRSNLAKLLKQFNYQIAQSETVTNTCGYASRLYQLPTPTRTFSPFKQIYIQVRPGVTQRGIVISPIEGNKIIVTLIGIDKARPERGDDEFAAHLKALCNEDVNHFLRDCHPISPIKLYRDLNNIHNHFGKMKKWPKGLIALGDTVCMLNPVYGQGMTLATKQAWLLNTYLHNHYKRKDNDTRNNWEQQLQKRIDRLVYLPWLIATTEDQRNKASDKVNQGKLPLYLRLTHWYLDAVIKAAINQEKIHRLFLEVLHMLREPYHLITPRILFMILLRS